MKPLKFMLALLLLVSFSSCEEKDAAIPEIKTNELNNSFVFGEYFGFCPLESDCATVYKIQDNKLLADNIKRVGDNSSLITFHPEPLPAAKYEVAKKLVNKLPAELLTSNQEVYGAPDAYDQGGLVLEFVYNGQVKRIFLERDEKNLPANVAAFAKEVKAVVAQIK
ncbi:hypothetical protein [Adhaeribacter aquaticus]|uniref:hypothetical protein n=1 Tax=Adhaeribacter aquaticus TaxID=299567 RepID=UPI00042070B1|nr:hypothetical protein [Adhaeribacter aquaticus]